MLAAAVHHEPWGAYAFALGPERLKVRLRAARGDLQRVTAVHGPRYYDPIDPHMASYRLPVEQYVTLRRTAADERFDYFEGVLHEPTQRLQYVFLLDDGQRRRWYGEQGVAVERRAAGVFQVAHLSGADSYDIPAWARGAVFYEIFPDRFSNGDRRNDPPGALAWGAPPPNPTDAHSTFYGGDLGGIIQRVSYLAELGVDAIWLTPIFKAPSTHKYDTEDYYQIDPHFGDEATLRALVQALHQRGMRLILDAVFNHSGEQFAPFQDALRRGDESPYASWFNSNAQGFPVRQEVARSYETFAFEPRMPKLMTRQPEVRRYLLGAARHWTELGIDGWRLDVANEVDHDFWREFRNTVRAINPEAFIVGEIWQRADPWLRGDQFDAVMNYPFRSSVLAFFAHETIGPETFDALLAGTRMAYADPVNDAMLNLVGSHDTSRLLTVCGGAKPNTLKDAERKAQLIATFQFTYPGAPLLYYGDEVAMGTHGDQERRAPMIWERSGPRDEMRKHYTNLISLRHQHLALRRGGFVTLLADSLTQTYAFTRTRPEEGGDAASVVVVLHNAHAPHTVTVPLAGFEVPARMTFHDAVGGAAYQAQGNNLRLTLGAWQGMVLIPPEQA